MQKMVFGCGYLGRRVAHLWQQQGDQVSALTRSQQTADTFQNQGLIPLIGDVTQPETLASLSESSFETVLYSVGFDRSAGPTKREVYLDGLQNVLERMKTNCKRFLYISSTSVHGESDGSWVDETTPCEPNTESGQICLAAEQLVQETFLNNSNSEAQFCILRLAGIYGPDRLLRKIDMLRNNSPISGNPDGYLNLIHVDDAAQIVLAAESKETPAELYLTADGSPSRRSEYYTELSRQTGSPAPKFNADQPAKRTNGLNKRCCNKKLKTELNYQFLFPSYREGLADSISKTAGLKSN